MTLTTWLDVFALFALFVAGLCVWGMYRGR